jgi:uncharacterized protein
MIKDDPLFWQGFREFNAGAYYACHDTLEVLWMDCTEPEKTFVQGILQISVACYHLSNQNAKGGMILLGEGIKRLKNYQPEFELIDVKTLVLSSSEFLYALQSFETQEILGLAAWLEDLSQQKNEPWQAPDGSLVKLPVLRQIA